MQQPRTIKHRRFRLFRKCICVRCTVKFFADYQKALGNVVGKAA
jgi:hypothetical protein